MFFPLFFSSFLILFIFSVHFFNFFHFSDAEHGKTSSKRNKFDFWVVVNKEIRNGPIEGDHSLSFFLVFHFFLFFIFSSRLAFDVSSVVGAP